MNTTLAKKEVTVNGIKREVGIIIEGPKMYGVLNKSVFVWKYEENLYPCVKTEGDKNKAAVYGRLFILERLKGENIQLNFKTVERNVEYLQIPEKDGVWCNVFENGYIRGAIDGLQFSWHPGRYEEAVSLNQRGFRGIIIEKIDTNRIIRRLKAEGYNNFKELFSAVPKRA